MVDAGLAPWWYELCMACGMRAPPEEHELAPLLVCRWLESLRTTTRWSSRRSSSEQGFHEVLLFCVEKAGGPQ